MADKAPILEVDTLISLEDAGKLLGLSAERIRVLIKEGFIDRPKPGRVVLSSVARGYARYWQEKASQETKTSADTRVRDARAAEIEQRIAEKNRRLVPAEEATAAIDHIIGACAEAFASIPAMISRDVAERNRIEKHVKEAQRGVAKRLSEAAELLEKGGKLPDAD
jgi:chromosome segregation ATPase